MQHPWSPKGWRNHCKEIITQQWEEKLKKEANGKLVLKWFDADRLSLFKPHSIWTKAGLSPIEAPKATVTMWFLLGCYHTYELLFLMKKVTTSICPACGRSKEDIPHILLICEEYLHIRSQFLTQVTFLNPGIISFSNNTDILLISILDPESTKLPVEIQDSWKDIDSMYEKSRQFCWNIHRKREKILQSKDIQVSTG